MILYGERESQVVANDRDEDDPHAWPEGWLEVAP